ncbi:uncharacterized protein LOC143064302 isoform X2 [Mytilus galloprovincialis]|uniref:uncharacterized protein LOC143064302 isoform X2 n=1 Tax=Mytilus galloprovincialis TaxID=29158 RepID=UPI003F7CA9D9
MSAVEVARFGEHPHNIPDPLPCGNYVASQLRCAYDDSSNLFPASAGSQRSYNKYTSVTMQDFFIKDFNETDPDYDDAPFQRKRETVADVLSKPHAHQMFHSWNVPPRYVASDDDTFITGMVPEEPTMVTPPAPERISRQMSLPNINLRNKKASAKGMTREYTKIQEKGPLQMTAVPTVLKPQRSRTDLMMKPSIPNQTTKPEPFVRSVTDLKPSVVKKTETNNNMEDIRKEFQKSLQPHAVRTAEHYFKLAPQTDRKVIERILRMTEKKHQMDNTLKKTLLPDAKDTVEKWLDNATEEERHVALRFFNSLAGSKLMGISVAEQKKRLQQVIKTLEDGDGKIETSSEYKPRRKMIPKGKGKFNHIRLLTPNTRSNRWMHTTWHHLPEYKEKTVENSSSHYIRPHEPISRHFVIHPDWG